MNNFGVAIKATKTAYDSAGSAAKENSAYMESLAAKVQGLKAAWQNLVTEGGTLNKFIKLIIDAGTAILKFANSDIGQAIIKIGALGLAIKGVSALGKSFLVGWIPQMVGMQGATVSLTVAISGLTSALLANPLFWAVGAGLLIFGLAKIIETDTEKFKRLTKEVEKNKEKISELRSEYDQLASKAPTELTKSEKERLKVLQEELTVLKNQTKEKQKQAYEAYKPSMVDASSTTGVGGGLGTGAVNKTAIQDYIKTLKSLEDADSNVRASMAETAKQFEEFKEAGIELNKADQDFLDTYNLLITANQYATDAYEKYGDVVGDNVANAVNTATAAMQEQNEQGVISKQTYDSLIAIYPDLIDNIKKQGNGYVITTGALENLMTAENLEKISINQSKRAAIDYINTLGGERLAYSATTEAIKRAISARLQDAKARMVAGSVDAATYNKMTKAQQDEYLASQKLRSAAATEYSKLQTILSNFNTSVNANTYEISDNTKELGDNTKGIDDNTSSKDKNTKSTKEQTKAEEEAAKALAKANKSLDKQTKKLEGLIKLYQDTADAYKITADYMVEQIDKEIERLEAKRDAIESTYDEQIEDAKNACEETIKWADKQYEASVRNINEEYDAKIKAKEGELAERKKAIESINEENDAIQDQITLAKAQEALAAAKQKKVIVFSGGKLQYQTDASAVQKAQSDLDTIKREQATKAQQKQAQQEIDALEQEISDLKDAKDQALDDAEQTKEQTIAIAESQRDETVASLESQKQSELDALNDSIAVYETYKQQWQDLGDAYENEQKRLIAQQVLGIKLEGNNWKKRVEQAGKYTSKYKKIMSNLGVLEWTKSNLGDIDTSDIQSVLGAASNIKNILDNSNYKNLTEPLPTLLPNYSTDKYRSSNEASNAKRGTGVKGGNPYVKGFAGGTTSTPTGIYKVGEFGEELMIGKGAGVISHNLTENLMKLGQYSPAQWISAVGQSIDRKQTVVQQFGDISLPNVTNASQFVEELKHFNNYVVQATSRR